MDIFSSRDKFYHIPLFCLQVKKNANFSNILLTMLFWKIFFENVLLNQDDQLYCVRLSASPQKGSKKYRLIQIQNN